MKTLLSILLLLPLAALGQSTSAFVVYGDTSKWVIYEEPKLHGIDSIMAAHGRCHHNYELVMRYDGDKCRHCGYVYNEAFNLKLQAIDYECRAKMDTLFIRHYREYYKP